MPPTKKINRDYIGYRPPPDINKRIGELLESGKFDTKADIISTAFRFWDDNKDKPDALTLFNQWLDSPETKERMRAAMKKVLQEERA